MSEQQSPGSLLEDFSRQEGFCKVLLDAFVLLSPAGKILKCNQMFAQVVGMKTKQILKTQSIEEIITFEHQYKPLSPSALHRNQAQNVYFDVKGSVRKPDGTATLDLSLGISHFPDGAGGGMFLIIRDITAEKALVGKYAEKAEASERDALTGLYNRRFFSELIESEVLKMHTIPHPDSYKHLSLIMLDIDFFKKVNDGFGHQAGDHVLQAVGGMIKQTFRKTDASARYGGEEFVILLPDTDLRGAAIAAEKFRLSVENTRFEFEGRHIPLTVSLGLACLKHLEKETGDRLIARADEALYAAKHAGRNRVTMHDGGAITSLAFLLPIAS